MGVPEAERTTVEAATAADRALGWIELLASEVGARRPTTRGERLAAECMCEELRKAGVDAEIEHFPGYATFGAPYGAILAAATAPALLPAHLRRTRTALALGAAAGLVTEGGLVFTPLSTLLSRGASANLVATIEPTGEARRTLCLVSHLDASRSGLVFHPAFAPYLGRWITAQSAAVLAGAAEPLLSRLRAGRAALAAARGLAATGLALLIERELRGEDVPGANDNASGVAVAATLAAEIAAGPLATTRIVLLATGCEESGLLGMQAFLRSRETRDWLFLNFDGVGAPATLRYLEREGVFIRWNSDPRLIEIAAALASRRPELGLQPTRDPAGLTYDTSAVLARGGRTLTISAQDETIPNLHWPTDTVENINRDGLGRALEVGRELIAAIDRGEAD